ncbi:DUF3604 domain-containing protein [Polymorphobacter arshaanensis]|uniref:DUF3604 domain-containing protein n=1 Tax=Glacieibacterium arshaanense TaxID=2511025 RepID=A0A4Y9EKZ8_9SPHN|nr:DUF3604 domain-containing protein [Polymorphobacter arshaanensis]TFU01086.1 DUF3604 domain-containing protein [Polymorphobacter arshaanensis]
MSRSTLLLLLAGSGLCALVACDHRDAQAPAPAPAATATADARYPDRVYWGDEHVHTAWSADAAMAGATLDPEAAVRFARGEQVTSNTGQPAKLHRAYDWVAITDHSDGMGAINEMQAGNTDMMADPQIKRWVGMMNAGGATGKAAQREVVNAQATKSLPKILMDPRWMVSAWQKTVDIMEKYNQPGKFTAFIAYEWTSNGEKGENLHRNVIFRDGADKTRATPPLTTFQSTVPGRAGTDPESLWKWLGDWETKTGGQVLAIPHNGNMSNGWMFRAARYDGTPMTREWAEARARWEPLYEVYQIKGTGEANPKLSPNDEFADFNIWDTADLNGNPKQPGDIDTEYWRQALRDGMKHQATLGTNPFKYGAAGGTDTHTGLPSGGEENNFWGKFAVNEPKAGRWNQVFRKEVTGPRLDWTMAAAGITGVWATSNTRAAIWDAMKRKETYASSGPRITIRFFGGYGLPAKVRAADIAATGYARGVPMGGDLKPAPAGKAPVFVFAAMKDPDGANLDRLQIVKGWVDGQGVTHEKIINVKWGGNRKLDAAGKLPSVGNTVDLNTATYTNNIGATELVGSFTDPDFDPKLRAFYYVRVLEIPTPRWTLYDSVKYKVKMDAAVPMVQQERAVTSPIWYNPA